MTAVDTHTLFTDYWTALETGDTAAAIRVVVDAHEHGASLHDVLDDVVCAAQAEVGRRWAANRWNVAQEHRATSIGEEAVAALASRVPSPPAGAVRGEVLVTCADGEWHSLPSRVLAAGLRDAGWRVSFLGASVPAAHLAQHLQDVGPDVVALSCMLPIRLLHARSMIEASRAAGVPVLVGGRGFGPSGEWGLRIGANAWAPDGRGAAQALETLPSFTDPAPPLDRPADVLAAITDLTEARHEIMAHATTAMRAAMSEVAGYDQRQLRHTEEDVGYIVDFVVATLLVDDQALFDEFMTWFADLLEARGVPRQTLIGGTRVMGDAITAACGAQPWVQAVLEAGITALS